MKETRKKPKLKKCKVCLKEFLQYNSLVVWCSSQCGLELSKIKSKQRYIKETKRLKKEYRSNNRSYQMRKAQDSFNKFIRLRDGNICISCGNQTRQIHCGHYLSIGSHPELRFHFFNAASQCSICNNWKSGNQKNYRKGLIEKIGLSNVDWLEGPHQPQKLTLDDIKDINLWYRERISYL